MKLTTQPRLLSRRCFRSENKTIVVTEAMIDFRNPKLAPCMYIPEVKQFLGEYAVKSGSDNCWQIKLKATGRATCCPSDAFDERYGYHLAKCRAQASISLQASRLFDEISVIIQKTTMGAIEDAAVDAYDNYLSTKDYIRFDLRRS